MASLQSRPPRPAEPTLLSGPPAVTRIRIVAASGAGLAYSNGLRSSVSQGRVGYCAERTPELPQTVRFVVGVIKDGQPPELVRRFRTSILELHRDPRLIDKL